MSHQDNVRHQFDKLLKLFGELGLPMNPEMLSSPIRILTCLGNIIDLNSDSLSIEKLRWRRNMRNASMLSQNPPVLGENFSPFCGNSFTYINILN